MTNNIDRGGPGPARNGAGPRVERYEWRPPMEPSTGVVRAVAAALEVEESGLPPLHDSVDADALNSLIAARPGSNVWLSFQYAECDVTVAADGAITVRTP